MKDRFFLSLLFDFYGEMLTEKQKNIFECYYGEDLSLQEIGDNFDISKQAAADMLKRTQKQLLRFENCIHAAEKFLERKKSIESALDFLEKGEYENVRMVLTQLMEREESAE